MGCVKFAEFYNAVNFGINALFVCRIFPRSKAAFCVQILLALPYGQEKRGAIPRFCIIPASEFMPEQNFAEIIVFAALRAVGDFRFGVGAFA